MEELPKETILNNKKEIVEFNGKSLDKDNKDLLVEQKDIEKRDNLEIKPEDKENINDNINKNNDDNSDNNKDNKNCINNDKPKDNNENNKDINAIINKDDNIKDNNDISNINPNKDNNKDNNNNNKDNKDNKDNNNNKNNKDNKDSNNKINGDKNNKDNSNKGNSDSKDNKKADQNKEDPNAKEDFKKLRESRIKHYSIFQIIKKSLEFSSKNIRLPIFNLCKKLINQFVDLRIPMVYSQLINSIIKEKNYKKLVSTFTKHSLLLFLRLILSEVSELFGVLFVKNSLNEYKRIVIKNIAQKDIEFFDFYKSGEIINGINKNESILDQNFVFKTFDLLVDLLNFVYLLLYLNNNSLHLTILFFVVQMYKFVTDYLLKRYTDYQNKKLSRENANNYNNCLNEFITNMKLVKSLSNEDNELIKLQTLKDKVNKTFGKIENILSPCLQFTHKMADTYIIFYAGKQAISGQMNYSDLSLFQNYLNQLKKNFVKIKKSFYNYIDTYREWQRFFEFYDFENKVISLKEFIPQNEKEFIYDIEFKNISFSYPLRPNVNIFNDLSLKIEAGKTTAFVGYSGGGKSTIVNLILRLYDPKNGDILLNGINLKDFNLKWLRNKIGCVSQEPTLNSGSIEDNIIYGNSGYTKEQFDEVCKLSNLDFVNDKNFFPKGFKSNVGEKGSKISGGQKQRIAIARALLRDIKILILDEATSALDSKNEKDLQESIDKIAKMKNITVIVIAHRLSTIKDADNIMFLDKGQIIESGTHAELLKKKGEYLKLVQNQLISDQGVLSSI